MNVMKDRGRGHQSVVTKTPHFMRKGLHLEEFRGSEEPWYMLMHEDIRMFKTVYQQIDGKY